MSDPKKPYDHIQMVDKIYEEFSLINPVDVEDYNSRFLNRLEEEVAFAEHNGVDETVIACTCARMCIAASGMGNNEKSLLYANKGLSYKNISDGVRSALYYNQSSAYNEDKRLEEAVKSLHKAFVCSILSGKEEITAASRSHFKELHEKYLVIPLKELTSLKKLASGGTYEFDIDFEVHPLT